MSHEWDVYLAKGLALRTEISKEQKTLAKRQSTGQYLPPHPRRVLASGISLPDCSISCAHFISKRLRWWRQQNTLTSPLEKLDSICHMS